MADYTYDDFKNRINIQDLLVDAGYRLNRRDGLRYPSYVRIGQDGQRVRGDKFIVTANGLCCFQPPERKNYNVISFIKEHPELFSEYTPGMSKDRLVNLVCNRLLNNPIPERKETFERLRKEVKPFDVYEYEVHAFKEGDWDSQKVFYPYFKNRGINLDTQKAFAGTYYLATRQRDDGKKYTNLSFPLTLARCPGKETVGFEERGRPNANGKSYKGMAAGSNATDGLWIARLENHRSDKGYTTPIGKAEDVYWFESALDAMAFYQLEKARNPLAFHSLGNAVFVSTGGNPSNNQFRTMLASTPNAIHHICFDRDLAGQSFSVYLALHREKSGFTATLDQTKGAMSVIDLTDGFRRQEISMIPFDFDKTCRELGVSNDKLHYYPCDVRYKDWNDQLIDKPVEAELEKAESRGCRR